MTRLLLPVLLGAMLTSSLSSPALAQATSTPPAAVQYGMAYIMYYGGAGCELALQDGVTPNPRLKRYEENGRDKRFADEAAVLNFLAAQGWEVIPYGGDNSIRFLLKRQAR